MGFFEKNTQGGLLQFFTNPGKYVSDFLIEETADEKGRIRRTAVYTGPWTVFRDPGPSAQRKLWITLLLSVLMTGLYVRAMLLTHLTSARFEVTVPLLLGLFPVLYLMMGALSLPFRGKPMRRDQYMHSFIRVSRSCVAISVFALIPLIITLILRLSCGNWDFFPEDWLFTVFCLFVPVLAAGIILLLRSIDVTEKENAACSGVI